MISIFRSKLINWALIMIVSYFTIDSVRDFFVDKWNDFNLGRDKLTYLEAENERIAIESNDQLEKHKQLIKALEQDAISREEEIKWSIDRREKLQRSLTKYKSENENLKKTLDSRIPVNLIE